MRTGFVIVVLAGVAVGLVYVRRAKVQARYQTQRLRLRQIAAGRRLWEQEVRMGELTTPGKIRFRVGQIPVDLVSKHRVPRQVAHRGPGLGE